MAYYEKCMKKLDNPAWHSLEETHQKFAVNYDKVKFYNPDFCTFGGFIDLKDSATGYQEYSCISNNFYVVGNKPHIQYPLKINKELICNQMVLKTLINLEINELIIKIKEEHANDLFNLVNLVQPGYFRKRTLQLGNYYGIYKNNQLVAVTGERMKMDNFTELSAIITHPEHTGKGYAKQLIACASKKIFSENKTPYLHVAEDNTGAIKLYEKLGFSTRRKISFWNISTSV